MATEAQNFDLFAPCTADKLIEVRTGKMKPMPGLTILSGIDKSLCDGAVRITKSGIVEDEHDLTFHGGPDKAVHGYCVSHYPQWQSEFPTAAERFRSGGFGENFVLAHMNERNVCIGDTIAVGDEVILEVSLPRQPCFKLNHRFQLKNFAPQTWKLSRTGWYYRVVREGSVKAGDELRLLERPHPKWTIERIQEYLHRKQDDMAVNEELAAIEQLGMESRGAFQRRVAKAKAAEKKAQLGEEKKAKWSDYKVVEKKCQTPRITSFVLEAVRPSDEPLEAEGAHAKIKLGNGLVRAYSIVGGERNRFELGVALDEQSRGGSRYLHEKVQVGDVVQVGSITEAPMAMMASQHMFVAGGVGITAFLGIVEAIKGINYSAMLHYAVRSSDDVPFSERVHALGKNYVRVYDKSKGERLDLAAIVRDRPFNTHLYFCGPQRLMEEAARVVEAAGVPENEVHYEAFAADLGGDPFDAYVTNKDRTVRVGEEETLLEVLQREFGDIPSSCEVGNCGTCKITLKEGRVEHRGTALMQEEKATSMLSCVSRGIGRIAVEI